MRRVTQRRRESARHGGARGWRAVLIARWPWRWWPPCPRGARQPASAAGASPAASRTSQEAPPAGLPGVLAGAGPRCAARGVGPGRLHRAARRAGGRCRLRAHHRPQASDQQPVRAVEWADAFGHRPVGPGPRHHPHDLVGRHARGPDSRRCRRRHDPGRSAAVQGAARAGAPALVRRDEPQGQPGRWPFRRQPSWQPGGGSTRSSGAWARPTCAGSGARTVQALPSGTAQAYYPGNAYVDWICADGYNWAPELPGASWRSFQEIFAPFYRWGRSTGKPMVIGEFGTVEGAPGAKAAWFAQADARHPHAVPRDPGGCVLRVRPSELWPVF